MALVPMIFVVMLSILLLQLIQQAVLLLGKTLKSSWFAIYHSVLISIDGWIVEAVGRVWAHVIGIVKVVYLVCDLIGSIRHITSIGTVCAAARYSEGSLAAEDITHVLNILVFVSTVYKILIV